MSQGGRLKTSFSAGPVRRTHAVAHLRRGSKSVDSTTMVADALMSELKYQMRSAQQRHLRVRINRAQITSPSRQTLSIRDDRTIMFAVVRSVVWRLTKKNMIEYAIFVTHYQLWRG